MVISKGSQLMKPSEFRKHQAAIADAVCDERDALRVENRRLRDSLILVGQRARRGDGSRTFDDCIADLSWVDDECRAALSGESVRKK